MSRFSSGGLFPSQWTRREWLRLAVSGALGASCSGWLPALAADAARHPERKRSCILLWMSGGPSQLDTFDLKPEHENGGEFQPIDTSVSGIRISEHLPQLARQMQEIALIRSMSTKEGDHARATHLVRTGHLPQGIIQYPTLGSLLSKELQTGESELPAFISIAPNRFLSPAAFGPGFLGPRYAPMIVGGRLANVGETDEEQENYESALRVDNLELPERVNLRQAQARLELLNEIDSGFRDPRPGVPVVSHRTAYEQAVRLMNSKSAGVFDLEEEPRSLREKYGRNLFGLGCLLARRLVENGVPFVEVSLNGVGAQSVIGWDTHQNNFESVQGLCEVLDPAFATLIEDLRSRELLETTLIVWAGEFGRTPKINEQTGRDHFPAAWSTVLAGGGIRGGQVVGKTSGDGMTVEDRPVSVSDFFATISRALGINPEAANVSNVGRPIRLVEPDANPVEEILL